MEAMTGLINHRLSKTMIHNSVHGNVRGIPIYIGADDAEDRFFGASGIAGTGIFADIPDAIRMTSGDIEALGKQLHSNAFPNGSPEAQHFYISRILPLAAEWNSFVARHTGFWSLRGFL